MSTRKELIEKIRTAFKGVSRAGGVSWSETDIIDDYGTMEQRLIARASDEDEDWEDVVLSKKFAYQWHRGSFCFLDAIGFKYYLPAAMCQSLQEPEIAKNCDFDFSQVCSLLESMTDEDSIWHGGYSLLSEQQREVVSDYLAYVDALTKFAFDGHDIDQFDSEPAEIRSKYFDQ